MARNKKKKQKDKEDKKSSGPRISNRRAWKEYHILEKLECGMVLLGSEVKSIRAGNAKIAHYRHSVTLHEPTRKRKLLAHRKQIMKLRVHLQQKGRTIVPLSLYFSRGRAKLEIGIAEGKSRYDKREALKKKQQQRDIDRAMRR